ncbi:MAG: hypothetical protein A2161_04435 [Candidatus Schekmanbacteria bacterium RBG_13_48_7]|uniref:Periplasmic heavy metal sensor n=1 Tax=Candidatus Schekmanbacteria bacterium RBG_13_48_7 TaxID=1817878 RepID=A0A1F7S6B3_9BACT|nr:MAG: hypothetical protein A2161_04435 [Candidatus Schekmanbacteria bacterium RBG_13_48_7]
MDFFTRQKFFIWIIIVLVILNLLSIASIWFKHFMRPSLPPPPRADGAGNVQLFLEKELNLSKEQAQKLKELREQHRNQIKYNLDLIHELKEQATRELFLSSPDKEKMGSLVKEIGSRQTELERLHFNYFMELSSICNPEQRVKLQSLFHEILQMSKPPVEQPPPGHHSPDDINPHPRQQLPQDSPH